MFHVRYLRHLSRFGVRVLSKVILVKGADNCAANDRVVAEYFLNTVVPQSRVTG